jgi:hypothetical protein
MTMEPANPAMDTPPSAAALAYDRKLEVLLDDMVASSPDLPPTFAARVVAARPFAPWEVRRASAWRVPFFAAGGLFAASVAVFLAPLGQLAPGTAIEVWGQLVVATLSSPVAAAISAGPALAAAVESLRGVVAPGVALAVLGTGLAFGAATAAALRRRTARVPR